MATKTHVVLLDDTNGEEAAETVRFGLDGVEYEIDLTKENAASLREAFATYVSSGRRSGRAHRSTGGRSRGASSGGRQASEIRAWAAENGHTVSDRGRIPATVLQAFEAAQ